MPRTPDASRGSIAATAYDLAKRLECGAFRRFGFWLTPRFGTAMKSRRLDSTRPAMRTNAMEADAAQAYQAEAKAAEYAALQTLRDSMCHYLRSL